MITNIDLERICNYEDNPKATLPSMNLNYIDFTTEDEEGFKLELKKHNRGLAIDAILDDKIDEYIENKDKILKEDFQKPADFNNIPIGSIGNITSNTTNNTYPTISAKAMSMSLKCNKLKDLDTLYNDVIMYLDNITNYSMNYPQTSQPLNIKLDTNKTFEDEERKLISRILCCSNLIAINGRIGPGNTVLIGDDLVKYFMSGSIIVNSNINGVLGTISGLNVIHTHLINPKKAIVLRGSNKPANGLNVITNVNNGLYYMDKTNGWENTMAWFELL